jgi:hypothetical protein
MLLHLLTARFLHSRAAATRLREVRLQGYCGYNTQALGSTEFVAFDPKLTKTGSKSRSAASL